MWLIAQGGGARRHLVAPGGHALSVRTTVDRPPLRSVQGQRLMRRSISTLEFESKLRPPALPRSIPAAAVCQRGESPRSSAESETDVSS